MLARDIIEKKRDGKNLSSEEIHFFIQGITDGSIPDYQMSALLMAIYFQGMNTEETKNLTQSMLNSGEVLNLNDISGVKVDKHSTGGVGDKISLPLVSIVAAAGVKVPMMSGRGLGHTAGTLDKLESIPGFRVNLSVSEFRQQLKKMNVSMIGQTLNLAPADKKIYALRDVTATVPSIPLITASIMSKKLAEGAEAFVFDVKFGQGAFMRKKEDALKLAESLVKTGEASGKRCVAYLTNMEEPLGLKIGHWHEIEETIDILKGVGPKDSMELTYVFAATMIWLGGKASSLESARALAVEKVKSGEAFELFRKLVIEQGGDVSVIDHPEKFKKVKEIVDVYSPMEGYVQGVDSLALGKLTVAMGGGRARAEDKIDHQVGIEIFHKVGDKIKKGDLMAKLYINKTESRQIYFEQCLQAFNIKSTPCAPLELIWKSIGIDKI